MKQILLLLILAGAVYVIFWGGAVKVLSKADIKPQDLLSTIANKVEDTDFVPEIATPRKNFNYTDKNSFKKLKENAFLTYDPEICFSFVDLAYSSGVPEAGDLINEYLKMFSLPEDKSKILGLLNSYKDKQTLKILLNLYEQGSMDKSNLLNMLSTYHTPEVAKLIEKEISSENQLVSQIANQLYNTFKDQEWYKEALSFSVGETSQTQNDKMNKDDTMNQYLGGK